MNRIVLLLLILVAPAALLLGQETGKRDKGRAAGKARADDAASQPLTAEREGAVMTFVEQNHPELKEVLLSLKGARTKEYEKAIRDIYAASDRLANLKAKDPELYQLELKSWTLRSRIQLTAARMAMADSNEIRSQLRELLSEQLDVRAALLRHEQQRVQQRLDQVERNLARLESDREKQVERQLELLMRSAETSKAKSKFTGQSAEKRPGARKNKRTVNQPAKVKDD